MAIKIEDEEELWSKSEQRSTITFISFLFFFLKEIKFNALIKF